VDDNYPVLIITVIASSRRIKREWT